MLADGNLLNMNEAEMIGPKSAEMIEAVKAHLIAGGRIVILTGWRSTILNNAKHAEYIRADADGKGFRLGWKGKKSVYVFANQVQMID